MNALFPISLLVALVCVTPVSYAQTDPEPDSPVLAPDVVSHSQSSFTERWFTPLVPERSDYWKGITLPIDNGQDIPLPPMPLSKSVYPGFDQGGADVVGSGFLTNPLIWKGVYEQGSNPPVWEFFTLLDPTSTYLNWHNYFQAGIAPPSPTYPPAWPTSGVLAQNFTDWIDLYAPYLSRAYFEDYLYEEISAGGDHSVTTNFGRQGFPRIGSPQHVDIPPTYPPRALDAWSSTSPLVPASDAGSRGSYTTRPTIGEHLDLITGEPLLQETDLELPFGSAVFRRIRTYAERPDHGVKIDNHSQGSMDIESWTRGWHGSGWMSSDMPLFFFDASQAGTITTGSSEQIGPVCYFVPDAHHAIPFVQQQQSTQVGTPPDYIAPDWFDAMLLYDKSADSCEWGIINPGEPVERYGWIKPPAEMKVYLQNRSVIYTIKMYYEDVDPVQHARPLIDEHGFYPGNGKLNSGVPYYGLVTSIEDKSGNRVAINYVDSDKHKPHWDPDPVARAAGDAAGNMPVRQHGWYKGMIDHVKLYPAGEDDADWSIYYTYRTFYSERNDGNSFFYAHGADALSEFVDYFDNLSHPPALHALLVYERDVAPAEIASTRELILPCDSTTYGPAEHVAQGATPPAFVDLRFTRRNIDQSDPPNGINDLERVFAVPATGDQNNRFDHQDVAIGPTGEGGTNITTLPADWTHQVRFTYADPAYYGAFDAGADYPAGEYQPVQDETSRSCGPVKFNGDYNLHYRSRAAYLLKTAVHSRGEDGDGGMLDLPPRFWLYRYQDTEGAGDDAPDPYPTYDDYRYWSHGTLAITLPRRMSHRYGPETVGRIYRNRPVESASCDINAFVNGLMMLDEDRAIEGAMCHLEPPPANNSNVDIEPGGTIGYEDDDSIYNHPGNPGSGSLHTSSTHGIDEEDGNSLPVGFLADTIFYRWSEPYRLDPRLYPDGPEDDDAPSLIVRPASWALYDGRFDGSVLASDFNTDLRQNFVGGSVSNTCEGLLQTEFADNDGDPSNDLSFTITQAEQATTGFLPGGAGVYSAIGADGSTKWYRVYRFITAPEDTTSWRGSLYETEGGTTVPLGPEVIWDMQEHTGTHVGDDPSSVPNNANVTHGIYYYPFNFVAAEWGDGIDDAEPVNMPRSKPMWWIVVDEYDSIEEVMSTNSSMAYPEDFPSNYIYAHYTSQDPWNSRRVVGLTGNGAVLSDRTWTNDDGAVGTQDPPAVLEAYVYDEYLRPLLKFSRGWGAAVANGIDETVNGLVERFEYADAFDVNMGSPGHGADDVIIRLAPRTPLNKWIRKGCGSTQEIHISSIEYYDDPGGGGEPAEWRAKLPKKQTFYDLAGAEVGSIDHYYGHWGAAELPDDADTAQPPLRWKVRVGPEHQRSPGGPQVRAVDGQWFNNKGELVWSVSGAMANPIPDSEGKMSVVTGDEVFLTYAKYDEHGREILRIEDIDLDETGQGLSKSHLVHPGHPDDVPFANGEPNVLEPFWQRLPTVPKGTLFVGDDVPADDVTEGELDDILNGIVADQTALIGASMFRQAEAEPLNLVTFTAYNNFGPFKVVHPNGLRDMFQYQVESGWLRELRARGIDYENDNWRWVGQGLYDSEFEGQSFTEGIQASIDMLESGQWSGSPYDLASSVFTSDRLEVISELTPNYDTAGRLTGLTVADDTSGGSENLASVVSYDGWGNPLLEISPDQLIKRYKYDGLGRLHKTFVGSKDRHNVWANTTDNDDDLILTEKLYYGSSTNDAFLPIKKWMYRERSATQYVEAEFDEPSDDQSGDGPAFMHGDSDAGRSSPGQLEEYGYDWRMRRVVTRYRDFQTPTLPEQEQPVFREERSFLDNLDRVRFVAVYAPEAPAGAPDPDIAPGSDLPLATDFLGSGVSDGLLSLDETVYNGAGQVVERRRYDPSGSGGYLVTHSYTDHADRALWSSSSGGHITKNVYDARGRLVAASEFAGAIEMSRTESEYGPDGNVEQSRTYERIDDTGPADLLSAEHRLSVTYTWYDSSSRVVATADMGSATFDGTMYVPTIPARPDQSPEKLATIADFVGATTGGDRRLLVGVDYPVSFFDSVTGEALARISCYWYDRSGKQNAVLTVHDASLDIGTGGQDIAFTIDRTEFNRYGQKALEHRYAYTGDGTSHASGDFELLGGMQYGYEGEVWPVGASSPSVVHTTQVRSITPLSVDPAAMLINWVEDTSTRDGDAADFEDAYEISGEGRFVATWTDPGERRTTVLEYNAPIIQPNFDLPSYVLTPDGSVTFPIDSNDWGHLGISNRPDLIKAVHLPSPSSGTTGDGLGYSMFFFYYADGLPAVRVDSRGIAIKYIYDSDGNLVRLESDDRNMPLVADLGMTNDQLPSNTIEYTYDALSRLLSVTTGREDLDNSAPFRVDTLSVLNYDPLGNLLSEQQDRFDPDGSLGAGGTVSYAWDTLLRQPGDPTDQTNNVNRLLSLTYPARVGTHDDGPHTPRVVSLGYGPAGGISDMLGRVETLTSTGGPVGKELGHVATYRYTGLNRLEGLDLGQVPGQPAGTFVHTDDRLFDQFGRVVDRTVTSFDTGSGTHTTAMHSEFGYDLRGQRLFERLTQRDHPSQGSRANVHSSFFEYDRLGRLVGEHYGTLKSNGFEGIDHAASLIEPLAQLYGLDSLNRRVGAGTAPGISIWEDADKDGVVGAGELLEQTHTIDARGGLTGLDDGTATESVDQDLAGAITELHGRDIYHDWLGRPVLALDSTGDAIFAVSYDGFGRVARRQAPWPNSDPALNLQRIETYFYDGVRRIQEVFDDPKPAIPPWPTQQGPFGGGGGNSGDEQRTEAEYIWSAASGQSFDTCHVQVDWWDREAWFIQDHQTGTVRAYTDESGEMVRQYRFDAFGNLLSFDEFPLASNGGLMKTFRNRLGHQGLFAERVDSHTTAKTFSAQSGLKLWYQSRSRWYAPELGRFMTPDPNATGLPTVSSLAMFGEMPSGAPSGSFGWQTHYRDGWDTHTAYGANPIAMSDPTGLFGFVGGMMTGLNMAESSADAMEMAAFGVDQQMRVAGMTTGYADDQLLDLDWAMDMSPQALVNTGGHSKAGAASAMASSSLLLAYRKKEQTHHILTRHGSWGNENKRLLSTVGLDIDDDFNKVKMHHGGQHSRHYHREVTGILRDIINNRDLTKAQKREAIIKRFNGMKPFLIKNPDYLYDTIKREPTRWNGPRYSLTKLRK